MSMTIHDVVPSEATHSDESVSDELLRLARETRDSQLRVEALVSEFVAQARPVLESVKERGIMGLMGMMGR